MKLVLLIGPHAVGKMTVGQELAQLSGLKLFHNHMTIDMVAPFFSYGTPEGRKLVQRLRQTFFDAFCESEGAGYILTFVWAFGEDGEREYIEGISGQFERNGFEVHWVELEAAFEERLRRNRTENRLTHKPTKRDLEWSERDLVQSAEKYRLNSIEGEISREAYVRIDTTDLSAKEAASQIWDWMN